MESELLELRGMRDFAITGQFLDIFYKLFKIDDFSIELLEEELLKKEKSEWLEDLIITLLKKGTTIKGPSKATFEASLHKAWGKYNFEPRDMLEEKVMVAAENEDSVSEVAEGMENAELTSNAESMEGVENVKSIENAESKENRETMDLQEEKTPEIREEIKIKSFFDLELKDKLSVLCRLCEQSMYYFDRPIITPISQDEEQQLRVEPIGKDAEQRVYWLLNDTRLYRETLVNKYTVENLNPYIQESQQKKSKEKKVAKPKTVSDQAKGEKNKVEKAATSAKKKTKNIKPRAEGTRRSSRNLGRFSKEKEREDEKMEMMEMETEQQQVNGNETSYSSLSTLSSDSMEWMRSDNEDRKPEAVISGLDEKVDETRLENKPKAETESTSRVGNNTSINSESQLDVKVKVKVRVIKLKFNTNIEQEHVCADEALCEHIEADGNKWELLCVTVADYERVIEYLESTVASKGIKPKDKEKYKDQLELTNKLKDELEEISKKIKAKEAKRRYMERKRYFVGGSGEGYYGADGVKRSSMRLMMKRSKEAEEERQRGAERAERKMYYYDYESDDEPGGGGGGDNYRYDADADADADVEADDHDDDGGGGRYGLRNRGNTSIRDRHTRVTRASAHQHHGNNSHNYSTRSARTFSPASFDSEQVENGNRDDYRYRDAGRDGSKNSDGHMGEYRDEDDGDDDIIDIESTNGHGSVNKMMVQKHQSQKQMLVTVDISTAKEKSYPEAYSTAKPQEHQKDEVYQKDEELMEKEQINEGQIEKEENDQSEDIVPPVILHHDGNTNNSIKNDYTNNDSSSNINERKTEDDQDKEEEPIMYNNYNTSQPVHNNDKNSDNDDDNDNDDNSSGNGGGNGGGTWIFNCVCGKRGANYDDGRPMTMCESCRCWQHTGCAMRAEAKRLNKYIDDDDWEDVTYVCPQCREMH